VRQASRTHKAVSPPGRPEASAIIACPARRECGAARRRRHGHPCAPPCPGEHDLNQALRSRRCRCGRGRRHFRRLQFGWRSRRVWFQVDLGELLRRAPDQRSSHAEQLLPPSIELSRADRVLARDLGGSQVRPETLGDNLPLLRQRPGPPWLARVMISTRTRPVLLRLVVRALSSGSAVGWEMSMPDFHHSRTPHRHVRSPRRLHLTKMLTDSRRANTWASATRSRPRQLRRKRNGPVPIAIGSVPPIARTQRRDCSAVSDGGSLFSNMEATDGGSIASDASILLMI